MPCSACAKRRAKLQALREKKRLRGQKVQAAALGAVLAVSETAGKVMGIGEDTEDGSNEPQEASPSGSGMVAEGSGSDG